MEVQIHPSWKAALQQEFSKLYFEEIVMFLKTERVLDKKIYPPGSVIFNAFNLTAFDEVKVVILGQDPYHGYNQAHGLGFSVFAFVGANSIKKISYLSNAHWRKYAAQLYALAYLCLQSEN